MNWSCVDPLTGKHEDIVVRKRGDNRVARFSIVYLGDRVIGELFGPDSFDGWGAISHSQYPYLHGLRSVNGFGTRRAAIEYLLNVGVRLPDNKCIPELSHHPDGYCGTIKEGQCWLG